MAVNDNVSAATVLSGTSGTVTFDNTGATRQAGEPAVGGDSSLGTVWFAYTPAATGPVAFTTQNTPLPDWDSYLTLFTCTDPTDFTTFTAIAHDDDGAMQPGATDPYGTSKVLATLTAGVTYYLQVAWYDDVSGPPERTDLVLAWAFYTPPPPAPTASTWTDTVTRPLQTMYGGDDIVIAGTDLDTVTTVTIGGNPQPFTIDSPTQITVHVSATARDGHVVVSNATGSATAENNSSPTASVRFLGPWIQPPDAVADQPSYASAVYGLDFASGAPENFNPTQLDIAGEPKRGDFAFTSISAANRTFPHPVDTHFEWDVHAAVTLAQAADPTYTMPPPDSGPIYAANPDARDIMYESNAGEPVSTVNVRFPTTGSGEWADSVDHKSPTDLSGDLWQIHVQYRRLAGTAWTSPDPTHVELTSGAWPTRSAVAALSLDFSGPVFPSGTVLAVNTEDDSGVGARVDNLATYAPPSGTEPPSSGVTVTWAEYVDGVVWLCALSPIIDAAAIDPPFVGTDAVFPLQRKGVTVSTVLRLVWTYRPPRYRLLYTAPPVATTGWHVGSVAW